MGAPGPAFGTWESPPKPPLSSPPNHLERGCPILRAAKGGRQVTKVGCHFFPASFAERMGRTISIESSPMPSGLVRYQQCRALHFVTFSCYQRQPRLAESHGYSAFERELEAVRSNYEFVVAGYVLMPEHVQLLVGEPRTSPLATALQVLKQNTSRKLNTSGEEQFWQRRYYDFNVWSEEKRLEKLYYMHRNPVRRGLVAKPEDWPWSSFLHYATGLVGTVEIESGWKARTREEQAKLIRIP